MHQTPHKNIKVMLIGHDADLVTINTFEALAARGYDICLATDNADSPTTTLPRLVIAPIRGKLNLKAIFSLRRAMRQFRPDIVYAVSTSALSTALQASRGLGVTIVGYRGTQARVHRFDPTYRMALLNRRVDHIVCETPDILEYLKNYIPAAKLSGHPKPYALDWVADALANPVTVGNRQDDDHRNLNIVYIGITKGRPHKGLHYLLEAIRLLGQQRDDIPARLTVVGQAEQSDIDNATDNVIFTGNRTDAIHFLPDADVFVLPSTRDASPRVVREAQACGIPCIVSDIPGARDLIIADGADPSGILVPPANPQAIVDAIIKIYDDPELHLRMCHAATSNIAKNYQPKDYTDYFDSLFKTLFPNIC